MAYHARSPRSLLTLPIELRLKIYSSFFSSTTAVYPRFHEASIPLLLTSHQIHHEASLVIPESTHYWFRTTADLVTYLTGIPKSTISLLRYITVTGHPFQLYHPENQTSYNTFDFAGVLLLFPRLQLDTLILYDAFHGPEVHEDRWGHDATYRELMEHIKYGKGWRELIFRSRSDRWLRGVTFETPGPASGPHVRTSLRDKQPEEWRRWISERDGVDSGAGVEMYTFDPADAENGPRTKVEGTYETAMGSTGSEEDSNKNDDENEAGGDQSVVSGEEGQAIANVGIEVRVRRGRGADHVQDGKLKGPDDYNKPLLEIFQLLTWKEIREKDLFVGGGDADLCAHL